MTSSPCAACKFLRRKCTQGCVFAPYFPPDQPARFANVHRVFGASNVAKLLNELPASQREDAVNSLAYEAEARLRDPVYGCVAYISLLQLKIKQAQLDLSLARKELYSYIGPSACSPFLNPSISQVHQLGSVSSSSSSSCSAYLGSPLGVPLANNNMGIGMGLGLGHQVTATSAYAGLLLREQQQQLAVDAAREQDILRYSNTGTGSFDGLGEGFNSHLTSGPTVVVPADLTGPARLSSVSPLPAHTNQPSPHQHVYQSTFIGRPQIQLQPQRQTQMQVQLQPELQAYVDQVQQQNRRDGSSDDGRSFAGPSLS